MRDATEQYDIAIIGAGIVGASIAFHVAGEAKVLLLEGESAAGYHTTGRSAALFTETYGPAAVRALTRASRAFFREPPTGFASAPLLTPRGTLMVGDEAQRADALTLRDTLVAEGSDAEFLDGEVARARVPVLRPDAAAVGVWDPDAFDIDVDGLLQGFLRGARARGAVVEMQTRVTSLRRDGPCWQIGTAAGHRFRAGTVVNAAGAWVDEIATLAGIQPIGIEPRRRSAFLFSGPAGIDCGRWPAVVALDESWYFKPDAGLLLGSPANADLTTPHDVLPEELDIATGIYRIEQATTLEIRRPTATWAGLRCFVADGEPVLGFDASAPTFFWAAALGGYGIQSSPAMGELCAALLRGEPIPDDMLTQRLDIDTLRAGRTMANRSES